MKPKIVKLSKSETPMSPVYCAVCGSRLADCFVGSIFEVKCYCCKCTNVYRSGTQFYGTRGMRPVDFERAETKMAKRRERRMAVI